MNCRKFTNGFTFLGLFLSANLLAQRSTEIASDTIVDPQNKIEKLNNKGEKMYNIDQVVITGTRTKKKKN